MQVKRGDLAGQARLEAFTLLNSVCVWRELTKSRGKLAFMGDALGVLHDARTLKVHARLLNEMIAELALAVAPMGQDIRTVHLWTQRNTTCDALSRLAEGRELPESPAS